jgi:hypothetical protein
VIKIHSIIGDIISTDVQRSCKARALSHAPTWLINSLRHILSGEHVVDVSGAGNLGTIWHPGQPTTSTTASDTRWMVWGSAEADRRVDEETLVVHAVDRPDIPNITTSSWWQMPVERWV